MPAIIGTSQLRISEPKAAEAVAPFWTNADIHPGYPASTSTVVKLMAEAEYDCTADTVAEFLRKGYLTVPTRDGQLKWRASDIAAFATALESRRRWRWDSKMHAAKWTAFEVQLHMARAAGFDHPFDDLDKNTVEDLLLLMVKADQEHIRQGIRVLLAIKLREVLANE